MSLEGQVLATSMTPLEGVLVVVKVSLVILSALYFIFSLVVVRQVALMTETLVTEVTPLLRAFSIIHVGLALGIIVLLVGLLFG